MNTLKLIKRKEYNLNNKLINIIFIGGKFYLDYILITNPVSKNTVIKFLWGWMKSVYTAKNYRTRYYLSYALGVAHFIGLFIYDFFSISNLLINIYPIIVQLYIGYRCYVVIKHKKLARVDG